MNVLPARLCVLRSETYSCCGVAHLVAAAQNVTTIRPSSTADVSLSALSIWSRLIKVNNHSPVAATALIWL